MHCLDCHRCAGEVSGGGESSRISVVISSCLCSYAHVILSRKFIDQQSKVSVRKYNTMKLGAAFNSIIEGERGQPYQDSSLLFPHKYFIFQKLNRERASLEKRALWLNKRAFYFTPHLAVNCLTFLYYGSYPLSLLGFLHVL